MLLFLSTYLNDTRAACPSCGAADHFAKSSNKCAFNDRCSKKSKAGAPQSSEVPITQYLAAPKPQPPLLPAAASPSVAVAAVPAATASVGTPRQTRRIVTDSSAEEENEPLAKRLTLMSPTSNRPQRKRMFSVRLEELEY